MSDVCRTLSDMAKLTVRLSEGELQALKRDAQASGKSTSALVRERLGLSASGSDERLDDFERRLSRLEEMAGV